MHSSSSTLVTVDVAAAIVDVPPRTLRQWIAAGALPTANDGGEQLVRLEDVRRLSDQPWRAPDSDQPWRAPDSDQPWRAPDRDTPPTEGGTVASGEVIGPDRLAPVRREGLALVGALLGAMMGKLDGLYSDVLDAKDQQLAAKDDLIAELRRQVERTEPDSVARRRTSAARREDAPAPPATEVARPRYADEQQTQEGRPPAQRASDGVSPPRRRAQRRRELIGVALIVVALTAALAHLLSSPSARTVPTRARASGRSMRAAPFRATPFRATPFRAASRTSFVLMTGVPLAARRILGAEIGLLAPRMAVALSNGYIAVVDTGNRRLALLDRAGRLVRSEQAGGLRHPMAIVAAANALYVLDAGRGAIERYDTVGRFVREVVRDRALRDGTGMALGRHGLLYVSNPRLNSIVVTLAASGKITRRIGGVSGSYGANGTTFASPLTVAVGGSGGDKLYVLDGARDRVIALTPTGAIAAHWPAPPSDPRTPPQLLPLPDGRLLVSDPTGAILVYPADSALPVFARALMLPSRRGHRGYLHGSFGLSRTPQGGLLVADVAGNRLLVVPMPR